MSIEPPVPPAATEGTEPAAPIRALAARGSAASRTGSPADARVAVSARSRRSSPALPAGGPGAAPRGAFDLAELAHHSQTRVTGEPYITHPLAAAQILADIGIDPVAVAAAILHDVPEDTDFTLADIEERFGAEVAQLVDGVTKLSKFSTHSHEEQQAENIRKMFLAMADDIRVVLIKLADRLHNMRTLYALPSDKQTRIARQTLEIYAPLAERLGIWSVKWELEDLAFKTLEPEAYRELARMLDTRRKGREAFIHRAIERCGRS
jgi:guanosine-3',5'-bis(diphosphate) 3'-pyrophosphohydrolase